MVHVLLVGTWPSRSCVIDSAMSNLAESLCLCRDPASSRHPGRRCIRWSQRWSEDYGQGFPKRSPSPLKRSAAGGVAVGTGWDLCRAGYTTRFLRCSPWRPDVDRCIGGWALSLRGWRLGCVAPFGCGSVVRARPRDDGYAFPGRRECRARVESSTASRSFEAGRVVSRWGSRWFSAPPSGAILSGSAWGAYKIVEGTFHCPKQILWLLRPHHPRWWGCFGVHGHPLGGAVCGHATVSNSRYHPAGWSVSPLTGL